MTDRKTCILKVDVCEATFSSWLQHNIPDLHCTVVLKQENGEEAVVVVDGNRLISSEELMRSGLVESCHVPINRDPGLN